MTQLQDEEILYKAKNSNRSIFFALICSSLMVGFAAFVLFFKLKYSSQPIISLSSTLDWVLIGLIITAICMIVVSFYSYFTNFLGITKSGIVIKYGVIYQKIPFEDIALIKKYIAGRFSQGIAGNAYTVIKIKNGTEFFAYSITDLKDFTNKIKLYYPSFNNDKGIIESYNDAINYFAFTTIIIICFATYLGTKILNMDINSFGTQILVSGVVILYICGFVELIKLIKQLKSRYFSEETRIMINSIKTSEKELKKELGAKEEERLIKLKQQEEENIVTNYCPICGNRLIDFKCNRCEVNLDNIYDGKKFYCINCGTKREDLEPDCLNCGFNFNF